jgi:hypothetical protein
MNITNELLILVSYIHKITKWSSQHPVYQAELEVLKVRFEQLVTDVVCNGTGMNGTTARAMVTDRDAPRWAEIHRALRIHLGRNLYHSMAVLVSECVELLGKVEALLEKTDPNDVKFPLHYTLLQLLKLSYRSQDQPCIFSLSQRRGEVYSAQGSTLYAEQFLGIRLRKRSVNFKLCWAYSRRLRGGRPGWRA